MLQELVGCLHESFEQKFVFKILVWHISPCSLYVEYVVYHLVNRSPIVPIFLSIVNKCISQSFRSDDFNGTFIALLTRSENVP